MKTHLKFLVMYASSILSIYRTEDYYKLMISCFKKTKYLLPVFISTFLFSCQNNNCEELDQVIFDSEDILPKEELILYLGGEILPLSEIIEPDSFIIYDLDNAVDINSKYSENMGNEYKTTFANFWILKPYDFEYEIFRYTDFKAFPFTETITSGKNAELKQKEARDKWIDQQLFAVKIFDKLYLIDTSDCINCTLQPEFTQFNTLHGTYLENYYVQYYHKKFIIIKLAQLRYEPWLWIFDITDSLNVKVYGIEDNFGPPNIGDFNNDGNLDIAVIQPGTKCNKCDSTNLLTDPVFGRNTFSCGTLMFYTIGDNYLELLSDASGSPYYINVAYDNRAFQIKLLSSNYWKKIN
jgi:hypothetical protein